MRPVLTKDLDVQAFKNYYWLKEELQSFCKQYDIGTSGSKLELTNRIETFLLTGEIKKPTRKRSGNKKAKTKDELSLDTVITENHRCSQHVRAFFKTIIPNFHFSTHIQNYFKENVGNTYHVEQIHAECLVTNLPSISVLEKIGMCKTKEADDRIKWILKRTSVNEA
ncbi:DUF6434 domain-containing protein [Virgibacillus sp. Bac330]|uniref:DUF6434 domain-containing protein n=1 Tax=Virgibacillus sp. Bac330 TaxID=2419841 RepID=UPI001969C2C5|nr:DUF6434 domain-containing protein [Virgibacillus sp. Bac330]